MSMKKVYNLRARVREIAGLSGHSLPASASKTCQNMARRESGVTISCYVS